MSPSYSHPTCCSKRADSPKAGESPFLVSQFSELTVSELLCYSRVELIRFSRTKEYGYEREKEVSSLARNDVGTAYLE